MKTVEEIKQFIMSYLDEYFVLIVAGKLTDEQFGETKAYSKVINFIEEAPNEP